MTVLNFTPHPINIYRASDVTFVPYMRKNIAKPGFGPVDVYSSYGVLSAKIETVPAGYIGNIPVFDKKVVGCDPLPDGDSICIVSALYATAARKQGLDMSRIYTVADPVFSLDGAAVMGCLGVCPAM